MMRVSCDEDREAAAILATARESIVNWHKKAAEAGTSSGGSLWLGDRDSNPGWLIQSQLSYH